MGLVLTGKLLDVKSKPYTLDNGMSGVSHKARVGVGRGEFCDVKVAPELMAAMPARESIPDDGVPVQWHVELAFGKLSYVGPVASGKS